MYDYPSFSTYDSYDTGAIVSWAYEGDWWFSYVVVPYGSNYYHKPQR